jgi:2-polyprenyl-3-methyl-5-hydroxy-6-metoxy-1,4-benzoquinol methylase
MTDTHVYERQIDTREGVQDSLSLIFHKIQPHSLMLDVGTGSGALGKALKTEKQCVVHGLSYNSEEVKAVETHYDLVVQVDLECEAMPEVIASTRYDYVVCADVLEHLRNAKQVLGSLLDLLKPTGRLILSVPNVSHMSIVISLLAGRFIRTHEGLLDATHVHFFERFSLDQFCREAGGRLVAEDAVRKGLAQTEFLDLDASLLPDSVTDYITQTPDADVYQFIWTLERNWQIDDLQQKKPSSLPVRPQIDLAPQFEIKLYVDHGGGFHEGGLLRGFGSCQEGMQSIRFVMPKAQTSVLAVRLDWPQWAALYEWEGLTCIDQRGQVIFAWNGTWSPHVQLVGCVMLPQTGEHQYPTLMVHLKNSYIEFQLRPELGFEAIEVRLSAPIRMPIAQANSFHSSTEKLEHQTIQIKAVKDTLDQDLKWLTKRLAAMDDMLNQQLKWQSEKTYAMAESLLKLEPRIIDQLSVVQKQIEEQRSREAELKNELEEKNRQLLVLRSQYFLIPNFFKRAYRFLSSAFSK